MHRQTKTAEQWQNYRVAVTGINAHAENPGPGMAVARCLKEHLDFSGSIIGLAYDALDAGLYAHEICTDSFLIPYPSAGPEALLERIKAIDAFEKLDAIIPCLDAELQNFISIESQLAALGIKMLIPSKAQYTLRAKNHLVDLCNSINVATPKSKVISDSTFFDRCTNEGFTYPLVVKGIFYDATICNTPYEAKAAFSRLVAKWGYPCLVQEPVSGDELNLAGIGDGTGNLNGYVMMRKKAVTDKGKAWAGVTVVDRALEETARELIKALKWRGPLEVEVIKSANGTIYLIEINPRFPSWIYLSHAVSRNLPITILQMLAGNTNIKLEAHESGTFFIRHARELIVSLKEFENVLVNGCSLNPLEKELSRLVS
jgi:carbamoyl-phosphate synthase large subunit